MGTPTDVAHAAALMLRSDGSFITGSDLLIDGGVIATMRAAENTAAQSA
jgi:NAD(P)-dependent dehydrogenase (short-subunit alcohol dehydrogenase family)